MYYNLNVLIVQKACRKLQILCNQSTGNVTILPGGSCSNCSNVDPEPSIVRLVLGITFDLLLDPLNGILVIFLFY